MNVIVHAPRIDGETVHFSWEHSESNPLQYENRFFFQYEGIELSSFSQTLWYDLFLGLQLRIFAAFGTAVELTFPEPIPAPTVAFWTTYHRADLVTISPIADVPSYSPWANAVPEQASGDGNDTFGVFFGGGKDSMALTCLIAEAKGADRVVLFQLVHPVLRGPEERSRIESRQHEMMLEPARNRLGVRTQRAWTNYLANIRQGRVNRRARPHLELYTVGLLPAVLARGVSVCSSAVERTAYRIHRRENGDTIYYYKNSRPEVLQAQSRYLKRVLHTPIDVTNLNYLFSSLMTIRLLAERYPAALREIVMCVSAPPNERWCYQCLKCVEYVFYSLRCGIVDERFDYDYFFTQSRYIQSLITYAESGIELRSNSNAPWRAFVGVDGHFAGFCHAIALLQATILANRLSSAAMANVLIIRALFGNALFPEVELLTRGSVEKLALPLAGDIAAIAAEHFTVVDDFPHPIVIGNGTASFDYSHHMPLGDGLKTFDRS